MLKGPALPKGPCNKDQQGIAVPIDDFYIKTTKTNEQIDK